jgi:hypothetical protein
MHIYTISIDPIECGGTELYCPLGSIAPLKVPPGFLSIGTAARKR